MTKMLLISAIDPYSEVQARFPQLGLAYLAASLRKEFPGKFEFKIINRNVEKVLDSWRPDVVGISSVSQNYNYAKRYARAAKARGISVIMGGIHISALPQTMTPDMDIAVLGEGEDTILEVMRSWLEFGLFPDYEDGTAWADDLGWVHVNPPRDLIRPMDRIPFPARDLLTIGRHANIFSSRGCPYRCTFCSSSRYWDKVGFFSAQYVFNEICEMVAVYGVRRISFYDDLMIADKKRLTELTYLIRYEPGLEGIKYWCNARANLITEDTVRVMKEMGIVSVGMGLESGNERVLQYLKGESVTLEDNRKAINVLRKYKIAANASFIIGSPGETSEEILDTLHFIETSGLDFADVYVLVPFPGTPMWELAKQQGIVSDDMDWDRLNFFPRRRDDPVLMSDIPEAEMRELYGRFMWVRLSIAARRAWGHPFFTGMLKAGKGMVWNRIRRLIDGTA